MQETGISVVITTYKCGDYIQALLDSLVNQEQPMEIVIVDSESPDSTADLIRHYQKKYDFIKLVVKKCSRGEGRNIGVSEARYDFILFTDGDAIANPFWVQNARRIFEAGNAVLAGKTIQMGYAPFEKLGRVELYFEDFDVTYPSVNLGYRKELFMKIGGFDRKFVTAEDIDLNIRAVEAGEKIVYCDSCIIYHRARSTVSGFVLQAFWNGFGRKQLTLKHRKVWSHFRASSIFQPNIVNFWYIVRGVSALLGYLTCKVFGDDFLSG